MPAFISTPSSTLWTPQFTIITILTYIKYTYVNMMKNLI